MPTRRTVWFVIATIAALIATDRASAQSAWYHDDLPPELQRLMRQAHDYAHNSNGNVFRSSRHFSPDRNAFRSSRHYLQKLAAAHEARPVRTFVRFDERVDDGPRISREFSFAHHLARYYDEPGSSWRPRVGYPLSFPGGSVLLDPVDVEWREAADAAPIRSAEPARATQQAAIKRVRMPDGRVKTIIYSVPIDPLPRASADDAAVAGHEAEPAGPQPVDDIASQRATDRR